VTVITMPDLVVVGAGSAGFSGAIAAAELGARVTLVGHGTIGGTCVNVGCVPSKTMIRAAEALHGARAAARFAGIAGEARIRDWSAVVRQKDELVSALRQAKYVGLLPIYNTIAYREGRARLTGHGRRRRLGQGRKGNRRDWRIAPIAEHRGHPDRALSDQHHGA
jgi:mercuric reductase